jgi:RNA polymerase sigma-70 factor (ECF subfamily)
MGGEMDSDLGLLGQWRAGDRQAGQDLFSRHFKPVYRFFEHKVGGEADELVQRTFLHCVRARDQFLGQSSFRTYLFAIARRELYGYLREKARTPQVDIDFDTTSIGQILTSPSGRLDRARQIDRLREALRTLPAEQQLLLELHYWHELDAAALGEIFDAEPGTIRVRLVRARKALRVGLDRIEAPPGEDGRPAPEPPDDEAPDPLAASLRDLDVA